MIRINRRLQDDRNFSWRPDDLAAAVRESHIGRAEEIMMKVANETAESIRAIFSQKKSER